MVCRWRDVPDSAGLGGVPLGSSGALAAAAGDGTLTGVLRIDLLTARDATALTPNDTENKKIEYDVILYPEIKQKYYFEGL